MVKARRAFQVFVKPAGPLCNLNCDYCYYLDKKILYPEVRTFQMPGIILEEYIVQHIEASTEPVIRFSWHGGEPTLLGVDFFHDVVELQQRHQPANQRILNGMQTNGTLLDDEWCRFLAAEGFNVGLSLDGPGDLHDRFRHYKRGEPTFKKTMKGYEQLKSHGVYTEILCVVNAHNVQYPEQVYGFFKELEAPYVSFLPLVERGGDEMSRVSSRTVPARSYGDFLCRIFDEWIERDIGKIKVQIFEEAARTAFDLDHSLCVFRKTCGDIPVIEHNGDFYSCDHFVDSRHNIGNIIQTPLGDLLESPRQRAFGQAKRDSLTRYCRQCKVRDMCNGGCPKNRLIKIPDEEKGLNFLCEGYRHFFTHCQPFVAEVAAQWKSTQ